MLARSCSQVFFLCALSCALVTVTDVFQSALTPPGVPGDDLRLSLVRTETWPLPTGGDISAPVATV